MNIEFQIIAIIKAIYRDNKDISRLDLLNLVEVRLAQLEDNNGTVQ